MSTDIHSLSVKEVRQETDDTVSVSFHVPDELRDTFSFIPGQYLTLCRTVEGVDERRNYSICTSPNDGDLRIAVKEIEEGLFSTWLNREVKAGDTLDVMAPLGDFVARTDADNAKHYVLFAAGSGITPILSIIRTVLQEEPNSFCTLVYGNRNTNSIIFLEDISFLKNEYTTRFRALNVLSREEQDADILNGRIDADRINRLIDSLLPVDSVDEVYACGPLGMIEAVRDIFKERGLDAANIHFEIFTTAGQEIKVRKEKELTPEEAAMSSRVSVKLDGKSTDLVLRRGGETILDAALKVRGDMPFACKGGLCATCKAKVIEGEVEMDLNYGLEQDQVDQGYILTCQAHPISDRVVVDFDA